MIVGSQEVAMRMDRLRLGWISVFAGALAPLCWIGGSGIDDALAQHSIFLSAAAQNAYFIAGPLCALTGIVLGWFGRGTRPGRIGFYLSLAIFSAMTLLIFRVRYVSGRWPWAPFVDDSQCGCG